MVLKPIDLIFEISFKSEIPLIKEAKIKGTAINFNKLIKIVPSGFIHLVTKILPPSMVAIMKPKTTPNNIPKSIFQCKAIFFINKGL